MQRKNKKSVLETKKTAIIFWLNIFVFIVLPLTTLASTSGNFQGTQQDVGATQVQGSATSTNYQIKMEVGSPVVGQSTSSFKVVTDKERVADVLFGWHAFASSPEALIYLSNSTTEKINIKVLENVVPELQINVLETVPAAEQSATGSSYNMPISTTTEAAGSVDQNLQVVEQPQNSASSSETSSQTTVTEPASVPTAPTSAPTADNQQTQSPQ